MSHERVTLEYQPETETYRVEYTYGTNPPSTVVVGAMAAITDRDPDDLDPLYEVVDPNALDELFRPLVRGGHRPDGEVTFTYHGYEVTVRSYGLIVIRPTSDDDDRVFPPE